MPLKTRYSHMRYPKQRRGIITEERLPRRRRAMPTSFRLSEEELRLLKELADLDGLSETAEIGLALRERAERRGLRPHPTATGLPPAADQAPY